MSTTKSSTMTRVSSPSWATSCTYITEIRKSCIVLCIFKLHRKESTSNIVNGSYLALLGSLKLRLPIELPPTGCLVTNDELIASSSDECSLITEIKKRDEDPFNFQWINYIPKDNIYIYTRFGHTLPSSLRIFEFLTSLEARIVFSCAKPPELPIFSRKTYDSPLVRSSSYQSILGVTHHRNLCKHFIVSEL